jgi:dihydroflavonol-4-reductase
MILITGGTGLLGTYLLYELVKQGKKVRVLIRNRDKIQVVLNLFTCLDSLTSQSYKLIEWIDGDILDADSLNIATLGIRQVYHCAAIVSFRKGDAGIMQQINVQGTENVINACIRNKVSKLVHVSSISALGESDNLLPQDENSQYYFSDTHTLYSLSKYLSEQKVLQAGAQGLSVVVVNPSNIVGAYRQPGDGSMLIDFIIKYYPFFIDGTSGYIDVRDAAKAMILLMESEISGERFVLNSQNLGQKEILDYARLAMDRKIYPIRISKKVLAIVCQLEKLRSGFTGKEIFLTNENIGSVTSKNYYSSDKFINKFNFQFIPIKDSMEFTFQVLKKLKRVHDNL